MSQLTTGLLQALSGETRNCIHYSDRWYSTAQVLADIEYVEHQLRSLGVTQGERVLLGYSNSYAFVIAYLAIMRHGAVVAPFNPEFKPQEFETFVRRTRARIGFFQSHLTGLLEECSVELQAAIISTDLTQVQPDEVRNMNVRDGTSGRLDVGMQKPQRVSRRDGARDEPPAMDVSDDTAAVLMYTSGTTGAPKAVSLLHRHLHAATRLIVDAHELSSEDVSYCFLPLFHINAQVIAVLSTLISGGKIVIAPRFSASGFWPAIEEFGITWVSAVPTVIAILQNGDGPEKAPAHLRFVRSASAQLPQLVARRFERRFKVPVIQSYGMTEAGSQICVNPLPPGERRSNSVGLPKGVELRIVNPDSSDVELGSVGEVILRGPSIIESYEEADNQDDFRDGWFYTGDMGRMDGDGYVYLTGRKKELINRAGEKVSPYEVEDVIREHSFVDQVAVIGLPDPLYGERVTAYVVVRESSAGSVCPDKKTLEQEILELCEQSLSKYKCPTAIEFVTEIPVGPTGKIQRVHLKKQIMGTMIS